MNQAVYNVFKQLADNHGIGLSTYAARLGHHQSYMRTLIKNDSSPTFRIIQNICKYENMTMEQFGKMYDEEVRRLKQ